MAEARIFRPTKNAMQSGLGRTREWVLEFETDDRPTTEPLMGWVSSRDTMKQVRLNFTTREEAEAYAKRQGLEYRVVLPQDRANRRKSYADNFRFDKVG